jgi:hypothetical protein
MITQNGEMYPQTSRLERCILCRSTIDSHGTNVFCSGCSSSALVRINIEFLSGDYRNSSNILHRSQCRTGCRGICIAVIQRRDGLVHFEFDLWRVDWELRDEVCANLYELWRQEVSGSLATLGSRRIEATFGKTYTHFDVLPEFAGKWKAILIAVLSSNVALDFACVCWGRGPTINAGRRCLIEKHCGWQFDPARFLYTSLIDAPGDDTKGVDTEPELRRVP